MASHQNREAADVVWLRVTLEGLASRSSTAPRIQALLALANSMAAQHTFFVSGFLSKTTPAHAGPACSSAAAAMPAATSFRLVAASSARAKRSFIG